MLRVTGIIRQITGLSLRQVTTWLGFLVLIAATLRAFPHPVISFDSRWYHFSFARIFFHIEGDTVSNLDSYLYHRWLGFPKFTEAAQGFFWYVTGRQGAVILPNLLIFGFYLWMLKRYFKLPLSLLVLALFACPMVLIHYFDTYIDFFSGVCLAMSFFAAIRVLWLLRQPTLPARYHDVAIAAIPLVMASNSKYQAYLAAMVLLVFVVIQVLALPRLDFKFKAKALALLTLLAVCCSIVPLKNNIRYQNPFYPVVVNLNQHTLFAGPEPMDKFAPDYPNRFLNFPPVRFFLSASEIDWAIRGVPTAYSIDSSEGDNPVHYQPARTGGWGGLYFLLLSAVLGLALLQYRRLHGTLVGLCLLNFLVLLVVTSLLPQSFMLRYYLYVPLIMIPLALKLCLIDRPTVACLKVFLPILLLFNLCHFHLGLSSRMKKSSEAAVINTPS